VELTVECLAKSFRDWQSFITLTELVGAPNLALGSRGTLEGYGTSRTTYNNLVMEWR
jgi:hypothetical protein